MSKKKGAIKAEDADSKKKPIKKKTHKTFKQAFFDAREKVWNKKRARVKLHRSFRRSYREDYKRPLNTPGLVSHALTSLKIIFRNWKIFVPLLFGTVFMNILFVGLLSEDSYQTLQDSIEMSVEANGMEELNRLGRSGMLLITGITTGGLKTTLEDVQVVFLIFFVASLWLITTYFLRHILAGNKPRFRDGLYNAFSPIVSVLVVLFVLFIHLIPIFIFIIVLAVAQSTQFLSQPLYAFIFWCLGSLLIILSLYLVPVSLISLSSVTVPGIYPMPAIHAATDLIQGRRIKYLIRVIFFFIVLALIWVIIMLPITYLDLLLKEELGLFEGVPIVPFMLQTMMAFSIIYATSYLYLYYRRMLDDPN